ncbi:uncharacterized protein LOC135683537 isoform X1 [Rhopilema esculentum]|uniref:uncharacterized protein LOC135683537 isoform X1 n=1 Tax=Rhopilema esculentum TaxID=499914 RepID=UPI0031DF1F95
MSVLLAAALCLSFVSVQCYEIVYPKAIYNGVEKRELSTRLDETTHADEVVFQLNKKDGPILLEMKRNVGFHPSKVLLRTFDDKDSAITEKVAPDSCYYSGRIAYKQDSHVLLDTCNGLRGTIEDEGKIYNLEPVEGKEDTGAHKLYEAEDEDQNLGKRTIGLNPFNNDFLEPDEKMDDEGEEGQTPAVVTVKAQNDEQNSFSLIPEVDPVYAKYPITNKTRYCEMFFVVDYEVYLRYNSNKSLVLSRMLNALHSVDRSYAAVNVRVVLVALEIWTNGNRVPYNESGGRQISTFNSYRKKHLLGVVRHDIAHYISIKGWSGGVIGMAYVGGICKTGYGTGIDKWSFTSATGPTVVLAHELGHNFGFPHDSSPCVCLTSRGCFMGGPKTRRPGFSDCNMKVLSDPRRSFECLNNYPTETLDNVCGNGIVEGSEECDCGSPEMCEKKDKCCEPNGCKLKRSAQCSDFNTPDCCKDCFFKGQGALCREAINNCDLPEYCPGNSGMCPNDDYMQDGSPCSNRITIIPANINRNEKLLTLNPPIKTRYLRINPVYWKPNGYACLRMEALTCSADEDSSDMPQPISTRDLYYTNAVCVAPDSASCAESRVNDSKLVFKRETYRDCNKPNFLFVLESDGTLRHNCSGKIVCPASSGNLVLKKECPNDEGKYERLANFGLKNKVTDSCVESYDGWPLNGNAIKLRGTKDCDGSRDRTKLHFLETDCLLPAGFENGKLPDSAFTASASHRYWPPEKARRSGSKGWCLPSKTSGKNEYLQIDLGKIKTVGKLKMQGASSDYVSAFRLFYSDDGKNWKGYSSDDDVDKSYMSYCYSGSCSTSRNYQCKHLWDARATSANESCWRKLNTEAAGYGTCDPLSNKTCAAEDIFCGQLQCSSSQSQPTREKYGSVYKSFDLNGKKCSGASITIPGTNSNDEMSIGMVAEGTKCGEGKMCMNYKCKSFADLNITSCGKVNGLQCAGRGKCDDKGVCHCDGAYDPQTNCEKVLIPINGNWSPWHHWSKCSAACDGGKRTRSRLCDSPFPAHGGMPCEGVAFEEELCNNEECPKAGSCKLLMGKFKASGKPMVDGVYNITLPDGSLMKMYCDMTRNGGGWTLVVSSHTNDWTTSELVRERNKDHPNMYKDYSILKYVDQIKDNYKIDDKKFEYRLEAHRRGRWGGIWSAPIQYKFDTSSGSQTGVTLIKKFNNWSYSSKGIAQRMPHYINNWLTLQTKTNAWGTITGTNKGYHPAAWIGESHMEAKPEHIWYWMREGDYKIPSSCLEVKMRFFERGKKAKSGLYDIQNLKGKKTLNVFCDMESFGGGWTLVLNKVSSAGWTKETTLSRNTDKASTDHDYSILFHSQEILGLRKEETKFQYMIEAEGPKKWGGIFEGHNSDGLIACTPSQFKPRLLEKFDNWDEQKSSLIASNPHIVDNPASYYTTAPKTSSYHDGVLVSETNSIYMEGRMEKPRFVRVWVREGASYKSCNQIKVNGIRNGGSYKNGFYNLKESGANYRTVYCDMTSDVGAWTLLVTSAHGNWTKPEVLSRNEDFPSIANDYSILHLADSIKSISNNATFKYKLDAHKFNHWGGIWEAPIQYTFTFTTHKQEKVKLLKQFDVWDYNVYYKSVNNRMPWLGARKGILTTSGSADWYWWGTIISDNLEYKPAPWISSQMKNPGVIWYWVNEDDCDPDRMPVDGGLTAWSSWTQCSTNCGQGTQERSRSCTMPKPRCGGALCDPLESLKRTRNCSGECLETPIRTHDSRFCVLPKTGGCSPNDSTTLVWKSGSDKCDLPEAQFIFDPSRGSLVHKCSGKPVCPVRSVTYGVGVMISTACPKMVLGNRFTRTQFDTLHFKSMCLHPSGGWAGTNVPLVFWTGCNAKRIQTVLSKIAHGPVHSKYWSGIAKVNNSIADLTNDDRFPSNPTYTGYLHNFDSPYGIGNSYGLQLWSYFVAPETGMYTFYAACDNYCQVFLSPNTLEKDKRKIIDMKAVTSVYQYDKYPEQKSSKIKLEEGKLYYLEGIVYEITGGDHLSVAVDFPSGLKSVPITSYYLREKVES